MHACPECGNHDMQVVVVADAPVHECGLCGARFGERRAIERLGNVDEAADRGVDPGVWPLVRALERLAGVRVQHAAAGASGAGLPMVDFVVGADELLMQLENLGKALRLAGGSLRCRWSIEVAFDRSVLFRLRPADESTALRDAQLDVEVLAAEIERDRRLGWWRHAKSDRSG